MARHLVAALLRSGEWHVRVTDLAPSLVLGPGETEDLLRDALGDGRAVYASVDVCNLEQLIKGNKYIHILLDDSCRRVFFNTYTGSFFFRNIQSHFSCEI